MRWLTALVPTMPTMPHMLSVAFASGMLARSPGACARLLRRSSPTSARKPLATDSPYGISSEWRHQRSPSQTQQLTQDHEHAEQHEAAQQAEHEAEQAIHAAEDRQPHEVTQQRADGRAEQQHQQRR